MTWHFSRRCRNSMVNVARVLLLITLLASPLQGALPAYAAGGAYSIQWLAADPAPNNNAYAPTYPRVRPASLPCPTPSGSAGRAADPLSNAVAYAPNGTLDAVSSLEPKNIAIGQIVPYEVVLTVAGNKATTPENGTIRFNPYWLAKSTNGQDFGFDPSFGVYCAFVDSADPGNSDPGNNAKVDSFSSTTANPGTSNEQIQGTIQVSGLNNNDRVVVELWVVLKSALPAGITQNVGNVQTGLTSAQTVFNPPDNINTGNQTLSLQQVYSFFTNNADLSVTKSDSPDPVMIGSQVSYSIVVTNNSTDTVANGVVLTDHLDANQSFVSATGASCSAAGTTVTCSVGALMPVQSTTITLIATVSASVPTTVDHSTTASESGGVGTACPAGVDLCNTVTVGTTITQDPTAGNNNYYQPTNVLGTPVLFLTKTASPTTYNAVGQAIGYSYALQNTGNVPLDGPFTVTDSKSTVSCPSASSLAVGATLNCTASYTVKQSDLDGGSVVNTATAHAAYNLGAVNSNQATATATAQQNRALTLSKTASPATYGKPDDTITYGYTVQNAGNVTLSGPFTVSDNKTTVTCTNPPTSLAPGASFNCSATYSITQTDLDNGSVTNLATASNSAATSNQASATVTAAVARSLTLSKSASPTTYDHAGQVIAYTYVVKNTGNVTVNGPFMVNDDKLGSIACGTGSLAPGATATCNANYTVKQSDLDAGKIVNKATATNGTTTSAEATFQVTAAPNPALGLTKTANPTGYSAPGQVIAYTYEVKNTGNVTLNGPFSVSDNKAAVTCPPAPTRLAPGDTLTCSASYTVGQGDLDGGSVTNTATATNGTVTSPSATVTVNAAQAPALALKKTAAPATYDAAGQTINYAYEVKNSGNVTLAGPFTVTDDKATVSCPSTASLAPGATVNCTAGYAVTQADLDNGSVTNTATAKGKFGTNNVTSGSATATVKAIQNRALELTKTADASSYNATGQKITYSYVVKNSGNVTIHGPFTVNDSVQGAFGCGNATASLAPNATVTCTSIHTVTQDDLDAGKITNQATATGGTVTSAPVSVTVNAQQTPQLSLTKSASPDKYSAAGQMISYAYEVKNAGNVTMAGPFSVTDDKATVTCDSAASLAPGASISCSASYLVTQGDMDGGSVTNKARATATFNGQTQTSNEATATATADQKPALKVTKTASPATPYGKVGDVITYSYLVENSGNVTLAGPFTVTDDKATVACPETASLAPAASITCSASYTITQADLDAGSVTNTAAASAKFGSTDVHSDPASVTVDAAQAPGLDLTKKADPTTYDAVAQTISYAYEVKNSGNVTINGPFTVGDDKASVTCPAAPDKLAPGETTTCSASFTVGQADLDAGSLTNTATAHGSFKDQPVNSNETQATATAQQHPALTLDKTASPSTYDAVGQTVSYAYAVKNTGNVTLNGPFSVNDDRDSVTCPDTPNLAPAASITCSATHSVTQADLDAGSLTNTATATNGAVTSNQDSATVTAIQKPALTVDKTAGESTYVAVGDVLNYSYLVTNAGNVTLHDKVTVSDDKAEVTCPALPEGGLAPGVTITCNASYTVTQADLDGGEVTNVAHAASGNTESQPDTVTVPATQNPGLSLAKKANPDKYSAAGQAIGYSYEIKNTGNVTLSGPFAVSDDKVSTITCSNPPAALAPGAVIACNATYNVTQDDVDGGAVTNKATATATFDGKTQASNEATATVTAVQSPALSLAKSATPEKYDTLGQTITYDYVVKNTGNVTLHGPFPVVDSKLGLIACGTALTALAPNDTVTCSAAHVATQADLDNGSITNSAAASTTFKGDSVTSNSPTVTVTADQKPALSLKKSASPAEYDSLTDVIAYSYEVRNTGNVTLHSAITVADDKATVACPSLPAGGLAPGDAITCSASHAVTQGDLDAGSITNKATGATTFGDKTVTSNEDAATVTAIQRPGLALRKAPDRLIYGAAGQTINYNYVLKNTGNVTLKPPFAVTDDKITAPNAVTCPAPDGLAPGATFICSGSYKITQDDMDGGSVTNKATATATFNGVKQTSNEGTATIRADQKPALKLTKSASPANYAKVGDAVTYSYLLENTGNVTLAGPFTVSDDKIVLPNTVTCPATPASLAPGAVTTCTAGYTATQNDLDGGSVTNTATAKAKFGGADITSNQDDATVNAVQTPKLTLSKSVSPATFDTLNQALTYDYIVTNDGNVTLAAPFAVGDDKTTVNCAGAPGSLAPAASFHCSATYAVTQGDLDFGSVTNKATATATFKAATVTSNQATATATALQKDGLTLTKSADPTTYSAVDQQIGYSYVLLNSGNVTLNGPFTVTDDRVASVDCHAVTILVPGTSITCNATYKVTQADLDAGSVTNTATAHATRAGNTIDSNTAPATVNAVQAPALSIAKSADRQTYDAVGQVIAYSYVVKNIGNVTLARPFTVTDSKLGAISCPAGSLAPGAEATCTASHTITQDDLDAGSIGNTATAATTFTKPGGQQVDVSATSTEVVVTAIQNKKLTLAKTTTTTGYDHVGQIIQYMLEATNEGNVTLGAVAISDPALGTLACKPDQPAALAPGAKLACTGSYTIGQTDLDNGSVTNHATALAKFGGNEVPSDGASVTVPAEQKPGLSLSKLANRSSYSAAGQPIVYGYVVKNTGNVTLNGPFTVHDNKTAVTCSNLPASLAPGASFRCTATYNVTQADMDNGSVTNTATASVNFGQATVTSNEAYVTVTANQQPGLKLTKSASPTIYDKTGTAIVYSYLLENTGNVTLNGAFTVSDNKLPSVTCPSATTNLAPGGTVTCSASYNIGQTDLDNGSITNTAAAHGSFKQKAVDSKDSTVTVNAVQSPALALAKSASPDKYDAVGQTLTYDYVLTNAGNVTLAGSFAVSDDRTTVSCAGAPDSLAPAASFHCSATYAVTQGDLDAGSVTNHAGATAKFGDNAVTSNPAQATVTATQNRALTLAKSANPGTYDAVGTVIHYSYVIANTGNVTLSGPFAVGDDKVTVTCPETANLAPTKSVTCDATHTVTQADLNAGSITNEATATAAGGTISSNKTTATVNAVQSPALSIAKSADRQTYDAVGQVIAYSYVVKNSGNVTLAGPFAVSDDRTTVTCPTDASLDPGASITCSASYNVTQADLDAGSVTNKATGAGKFGDKDVTSNEATAKVDAVQKPALSLAKSADVSTYSKVGDVINYGYAVKNTGNVTLDAPFSVADDKLGTISCGMGTVAPNATVTCSASHTITQGDLDGGSIKNTATASTTYGGKTVSSNPSSVTVTAQQNPALTLSKSASPVIYSAAGQVVVYSYTATNSGNVTLTGPVGVTDDKLGTFQCGTATGLAPGASVSCTANHTIAQANLGLTSITNRATATAAFGSQTVTSNQAQATINRAAPTGQVAPTNTTCQMFAAGTAPVLPQFDYLVKRTQINSVAPGVMFYYSKVTAPSASFTIQAAQTNNGAFALLGVHQDQVILYDANCNKSAAQGTTTVNADSSLATIKVSGATAGATYYLGIKYDPKPVVGQAVTTPYPTVTYTFVMSINNAAVLTSWANIDMKAK